MVKENKKNIKKSKTNTKSSKDKKEVCEIFEVEKDGKEKEIKSCGTDKTVAEKITKKRINYENMQLKWVLIVFGILIILFIGGYFFISSLRHFDYRGVKFDVISEKNLIFYKTFFPIYSNGKHTADYNFFIRNDPRKLDKIPFKGDLVLRKNIVINMTGEFNCSGDEIIAIANLVKPFNTAGAKVIKDDNADCDSQGRYTFIKIKHSKNNQETNIEQFGPSCYNININNCEILKGTERFMIETFVKVNKNIKH